MQDNQRFIHQQLNRHLFPVILSMLLFQLCSIGNTLVVGNAIGAEGLAVLSSMNTVFFTFATLGALLCVGGSTLVAHYVGENDKDAVNAVFSLCLYALAAIGFVTALLGSALSGPLLGLLGVPEALRATAGPYLRVYLLGSFAAMGIYLPFNFLKLVGRQNASVGMFLVLAAANIGLDLLLVLGLKMRMEGIALATVLALYLAFGLGLWLLCGKKGVFRIVRVRGRARDLTRLLRLGSPAAINNLCNTLRTLSLNQLLAASLGAAGLTAFSVVATASAFAVALHSGTAQTVTPFIGVFHSEKDNPSIRQIMRRGLSLGLPLIAAFALLTGVFAGPFCALFKVTEPSLVAVAAPALRAFSISLPIALVNYLLIGLCQATGRTWLANLLTVGRSFAGVVLLALLFWETLGGGAIWYAFLGAETLALLGYFLIGAVYSRRRAFVQMPWLLDTQAETEGKYIAFSVPRSDNSAAESSERITDFCEANALPPKTTMTIGLALEELLVMLNRHALRGDPGAYANVRILIVGTSVLLRIRCGGKPFNPVEYAEKAGEDEELSALGIRLIRSLARGVEYTRTFGANNLTIWIETA